MGLCWRDRVFNHSMNYRSVVALGKATLVDAPQEKLEALRAFTEKIFRGAGKMRVNRMKKS